MTTQFQTELTAAQQSIATFKTEQQKLTDFVNQHANDRYNKNQSNSTTTEIANANRWRTTLKNKKKIEQSVITAGNKAVTEADNLLFKVREQQFKNVSEAEKTNKEIKDVSMHLHVVDSLL